MSNNIFNKDYRRNFIKNSDNITLNEYLKNIEKLSKKGGKYLDIYNEDLTYLGELSDAMEDDIFKRKGNIFDMIFGNSNLNINEEESEEDIDNSPPCNTEAFVNKINKITQKDFNKPKIDEETNELNKIKYFLENNQFNNSEWINIINRYIEILLNHTKENKQLNTIFKQILQNPKYLKQAYYQTMKILNSDKDKKISMEFIKYYRDLRKNKDTMDKNKYKTIKERLINEQIKKLGPNANILINKSKLVEKIIEQMGKG